jgi:hypothetical protein
MTPDHDHMRTSAADRASLTVTALPATTVLGRADVRAFDHGGVTDLLRIS